MMQPFVHYMAPDAYPTVMLYAVGTPSEWERQWPAKVETGTTINILPGEQSDAVSVARLRAGGVSGPDALRILAALDWDCERALLVVREAKAAGVDAVALAREIGRKREG